MKYLISVGHTYSGTLGCGAVDLLDESNCTREVASLVVSKLKNLGYETVLLRVDKGNSYNCEDCYVRSNQANAEGGDLFVEIHFNSGINRTGDGCEVLTISNDSIAQNASINICNALSNSLGISNRGVKSQKVIVLTHTSIPAILVECMFVDGKNADVTYDVEKIANAIVKGLTGIEVSNNGKWLKGTSQGNTNKWWYKHSDGSYTTNNWEQIDCKWYYFDKDGWMQTGWIESPYSHKWYYCYSNGEMAHDVTMYGYKFDSNGVATKL